MPQKYTHLADSDQEDAILRLHGLKSKDDNYSMLFSKICPSCKEHNSADKSHCTKCGFILSKKLAQERESRRRDQTKNMEIKYSKEVASLRKDYDELKNMLAKVLNEK